jgi:hypothetical protein
MSGTLKRKFNFYRRPSEREILLNESVTLTLTLHRNYHIKRCPYLACFTVSCFVTLCAELQMLFPLYEFIRLRHRFEELKFVLHSMKMDTAIKNLKEDIQNEWKPQNRTYFHNYRKLSQRKLDAH